MAGWVRHKAMPESGPHVHLAPQGASLGDLYRCVCGVLLVRVPACDVCRRYGDHRGGGICVVGHAWRPASVVQRVWYFRRGRA